MFVGRAAELARLAAARERAPGVVLVVGEAGIGKTRLVGEFVSGADAFVAEGGADPGCVAYAPFVPVLRGLVRQYGAGLVPGGGRRGLARLLPELGEVEELPDLGRARLFEEVLLLVERSAERRPLVLVLEDLHWADQASVDLLVFLARNLMAPGVLVVATSREPLRLPGAEVIRVPPLGRDEVAQLLGRQGEPLDLDVIVTRSEGNPLFAEALADAAAATLADARVGAGAATPASLRELLLAGAERLPAQGLEVLRIAAVAGRRTPHDVLRAVAGLDDLALDEALRPVVRARLLLVDGDGYTFRHALIRDAVYDDLLPGERRRLHARCAEAHPELAADHWYAAGDRPRAFEAARAARRWERVLELWDQAGDGADHVQVLELAARDALGEGDAERAEELATRALEEADDPLRSARLLELRVAVRDLLGEEGLDDLRAAVRLAPRESRLIGALATMLAWNGQDTEARTHAEEALALGDTRSLTTLAALTALDGDLGAASRLYAEARATAPDDDSLLITYASEADVLEAAGEHARAESVAREGIARARRLGLARSRGGHLAANLAEPLASLGRWKEAREVMRSALALDPPPIHRAWILMVLGTVAVWEGALGEAEEIVGRVRPLMRGRSRGYDSCLEPDLLECRLALAGPDPRRAGRVVDHVLAEHDLTLSRRYAWPLLALAAGLGRVREAPGGVATTGRVQQAHRATFEAECGGSWEVAVAGWRAVGQPYALGQALVRAAEQDPGHARERLREAVAIAGGLGSEPLRHAAESAAATLRVPLGEEPLLSAREREVLGLVAEGLSNRQIAERLFISARTSGVHVSNIMAKLGAASRVEAVARARRTGLI
ncbi:DNA-binding CsgD family transcriptional regulator/tetratricopeptide (TPR) repeat protein [Nonomuraea thailandensis]|uniref:DNA-binding CsgD family transcriptional regulator/tetratricopeptide (TPR) repeat protein n=1 Tax=Nonomuraea thailandensis TaxID=1188745 RepID=A0A9X2GUD3_9ACTN|nr:AAA family ATPase [Nonomuraea thailandensis]MCP2365286.1 DNA-binding CsgD family transcriptional regulator/tetratricopeptide (TPR) repeat protein [Nonomuraea thailandensis]